MKLSEYNFLMPLIRDADFNALGPADSRCSGLLAYADSLKYLRRAIENPYVSCLITKHEFAEDVPSHIGLVLSESPRDCFYRLHEEIIAAENYSYPFEPGIGSGCKIHPTAIVDPGCRIGENTRIGEQVIIRRPVWIGSNVVIEPGAKIGMEGILYRLTENGPSLIPHGGYVRIHDNATLMTNSVIVRSVHLVDPTVVGRFALIGLGSIVGHDAKVGDRAVVSNQCVIARKATLGREVFIGTHSMVLENVSIGDGVRVLTGSVVVSDVPADTVVSGNFATDHQARMLEFSRSKKTRSNR